jgi:prepilin-type N-terminal cleavage/methylation domain-containing protein
MELRNRQNGSVTRKSSGRRGFTLVEIMVAVMLLGVMATSLAGFTGYVGKSRVLGKQRSMALVVGQEALEDARSRSFASTVVGTVSVGKTIGRFPLTVTTTIAANGTSMKLIEVSVRNAGSTELQHFTTTIFKETH